MTVSQESVQESISPQRAAIEAFFFGGTRSPKSELKKLDKHRMKVQAKENQERKHAEFRAIDALWGEMDDNAESVENQLQPILARAASSVKPDASSIRKTVQTIADKVTTAAISASPTKQWLAQFQQMLDDHEIDAEARSHRQSRILH